MQGFNMGRYVPPDHEGLVSGNALAKKHALGSRARKSAQGILTVRFEMPFMIWCSTCPKPTPIGQGVRFNAEKKKIGAYHSTPIYSFRMRHGVCGGVIEIRTDPKNTAYEVVEGAKKRDYGEGKDGEGEIVIRTEEEKERLRNDAFAALEVKIDDRRQQRTDKTRIEELLDVKGKDWEDPYAGNKRARRAFRAERKLRQGRESATEALRERLGLGIELLDENEEDRRRAGFVDFGAVDGDVAMVKVRSKPLFEEVGSVDKGKADQKTKITKGEAAARQRREELRKELGQNTRAVLDPFLGNGKAAALLMKPSTIIRKKDSTTGKADTTLNPSNQEPQQQSSLLVDYDSD